MNPNMTVIEDEMVPVQTAAEIIAEDVLSRIFEEQQAFHSTIAESEQLRENGASSRITTTERLPSTINSERAGGLNSSNILYDH